MKPRPFRHSWLRAPLFPALMAYRFARRTARRAARTWFTAAPSIDPLKRATLSA